MQRARADLEPAMSGRDPLLRTNSDLNSQPHADETQHCPTLLGRLFGHKWLNGTMACWRCGFMPELSRD